MVLVGSVSRGGTGRHLSSLSIECKVELLCISVACRRYLACMSVCVHERDRLSMKRILCG